MVFLFGSGACAIALLICGQRFPQSQVLVAQQWEDGSQTPLAGDPHLSLISRWDLSLKVTEILDLRLGNYNY